MIKCSSEKSHVIVRTRLDGACNLVSGRGDRLRGLVKPGLLGVGSQLLLSLVTETFTSAEDYVSIALLHPAAMGENGAGAGQLLCLPLVRHDDCG